MTEKQRKFLSRQRRVRAQIAASGKPRLSVYRSNVYIYAQVIDDVQGKTLVAAGERELKTSGKQMTKTDKAHLVGELLAKKALDKKITTVVFDRSGYKYHGRVKALADGARKGGLKF